MISNYWFPSLPVFPDNYAPQAHDPGIMYVSCLAPTRIPVKGLFTDLDTMESAIVVSVTGVSDSDVFSAEVINGDIVTTPLDIRDGESGEIYLTANSNGEIADMTLTVRFSSSGIDDLASDLEEASYYSIDGQKLYSRPSAPGIYILHTPAGSSHKFFIH